MLDRDFLRGFVKIYALWRASRGEVYGLEIMQEMAELGFTLSAGTLYPTLRKLLNERDVVMRKRLVGGRIRKYYVATSKGRAEIKVVKQHLKSLVGRVFS